jgi:hypothetical protein
MHHEPDPNHVPTVTGQLRFSPALTAVMAGLWLLGIMWVFFFPLDKRSLLRTGKLMFLTSLDFVGKHSFDPGMWWDRLLDVGTTVLLLISAWAIGLALMRLFRWVRNPDTVTHVTAIALGLGVWAWVVLLAGLGGVISFKVYIGLAIGSLVLTIWHWRYLRKPFDKSIVGQAPRLPCPSPSRTAASGALALQEPGNRNGISGFEWFLVVSLVLGGVLHVIPAFTPELEYDTLEYHLGALSEYRKAGHIYFLEHNFYASMPSLTEMLYLWGIEVRSSTVAKLLHASFALLTAIGLIGLGKKFHSRRLGLLAASLYYLLPTTTDLAATARIDLATTFFAFVAGAMLHRFLFDDDACAIWPAAIACGLAMATKYTAGPVVALPMLIILLGWTIRTHWQFDPQRYRGTRGGDEAVASQELCPPFNTRQLHLGYIVTFSVVAIIPVLPWLVKNWVFTSNPVYPIADNIFKSPYWGPEQTELFHRVHAPSFGSISTWTSLITLAWVYSTFASLASPILILFVPLLLLLKGVPVSWKYCSWLGLAIYACWWFFTFRPERFLFPALPWFAVAGGIAIVRLESERTMRLLLQVILAIMLLFQLNCSFLFSAIDVRNPSLYPPQVSNLAVFLGQLSRNEYLGRRIFTQGWLNTELPPNSKVLYVGEARIYYAAYPLLSNTVFDKSIVGTMVAHSSTTDDVLHMMKQAGVTHIYINQAELDRLSKSYGYLDNMNWDLFRRFLEEHTKKIYENGAHSVYLINQAEPEAP